MLKQKGFKVDAIFDSGLNRPLERLAAQIVLAMNAAQKNVISVAIPSGLFCGKVPGIGEIICG